MTRRTAIRVASQLAAAAALLLLALALSPSCKKRVSKVRAMHPRDAPAELKSAVAVADRAFKKLGKRLKKQLMAAMKDGGPVAAVKVCRDVAQLLTAKSRRSSIVAIGRTSHRLRNAANVPPSWVEPYLALARRGQVAADQPRIVDLGHRVGVLRPIRTKPLCVSCHGARSRLDAKLRAALSKAYPNDRAFGFSPGDLRGYFWAEVTKPTGAKRRSGP